MRRAFARRSRCGSVGGNSAKATSGINGALTEFQERAKIADTWDGLQKDTIRFGPPPPA